MTMIPAAEGLGQDILKIEALILKRGDAEGRDETL